MRKNSLGDRMKEYEYTMSTSKFACYPLTLI